MTGKSPIQDAFTLDLASDLMAVESVSPSTGEVFDILDASLSALGFEVWREVMSEPHHEPVENLYARIGQEAPNLCFAGHLDVVPAGPLEAWSVPPFKATLANGQLVGRGASDMKSAVAAFVSAVRTYLEANTLKGSISFLITGDEEGTALNGTAPMLQWMEGRGEKIDHCLVGEPTSQKTLGDMVKIGRRGSLNARLHVRGAQGHVAYPKLADNPMPRLIEMLHRLTASTLDKGTQHFQPSNLEVVTIDTGNGATNVIPGEVVAGFNIRFNNLHTEESLISWIEEHLDAVTAEMGGSFELQARASGEAFLTEPCAFTEKIQAAIRSVCNIETELSTSGGTSDARFITHFAPVAELGLVGKSMHKADEHTSLDDLSNLTKIYLEILTRYF